MKTYDLRTPSDPDRVDDGWDWWRALHDAMEMGARPDLTSYWCPHLPHRWYPDSTDVSGREVIVSKATFMPIDPSERCLACAGGFHEQQTLWGFA